MAQEVVVEASKPASPAQESPSQPLPEVQQQLVDVSKGGGSYWPCNSTSAGQSVPPSFPLCISQEEGLSR